jgi:hypothetical protein
MAHHSYAGERSSIQGLSLASTVVANTGGLDAIGINPARLIRFERPIDSDHLDENYTELPHVTFSLLPAFSLNFGTDLINYDIYSKYFTGEIVNGKKIGKRLSDADKKDILSIFPEGVAETHLDFEARLFGITLHNNSIGSIGFSATEKFNMNFDLSKDFLRFPLYGLDSLGSEYDFNGTTINAISLREYAFTYAYSFEKFPIPVADEYISNFAAGISVKYVQGLAYIDIDKYNVKIGERAVRDNSGYVNYSIYGDADLHFISSKATMFDSGKSFTPFPHDAGKGIGVDVGIAFEALRGVRFGMSLVDIGSVEWTKNVVESKIKSHLTGVSNVSSQADRDSVEAFVDRIQKDLENFKGDTISSVTTSLPTALYLGAAWMQGIPYVGNCLLAVQYKQGFNDVPGNSTRPRFSLAAEYRPWIFLPLRMGTTFGGKDRFSIGAGLGFDFYYWNFDIGSENISYMFIPNGFHQVSFGMAMKIRI